MTWRRDTSNQALGGLHVSTPHQFGARFLTAFLTCGPQQWLPVETKAEAGQPRWATESHGTDVSNASRVG